jgi:hypothetical protein
MASPGRHPDVLLIDAEPCVMFDFLSASRRTDTPARRFPG